MMEKHLCAVALLLGLAAHALAADDAGRAYVRAGSDTLIRACTQNGHTLSILARPGVAVPAGGSAPAGLPVEPFMQGLTSLVRQQVGLLPHGDFLRPDSDGTRRLSDAVEQWMDRFNREHGVQLAWSIADFGVSDSPQADCAR
ncbi:hypothetical protein [Methyloversatilis sp.]|uniref:hypothetical protein n=2 Tax=Methyloversatilis sp. TaxID=2569862 RepID=UPI002732B232|nr:hypothetical protein [Methyloversatilis sp.]MDP3456397.1 hypothetical protein [Methyloversatilis sp.]MDP3577745.1 hypothetical protein [Methyloversatilis sp.]